MLVVHHGDAAANATVTPRGTLVTRARRVGAPNGIWTRTHHEREPRFHPSSNTGGEVALRLPSPGLPPARIHPFTNCDCSRQWRSLPRRASAKRYTFPFRELRSYLQHALERWPVEMCFKTGEERLKFIAKPDLNGSLQLSEPRLTSPHRHPLSGQPPTPRYAAPGRCPG